MVAIQIKKLTKKYGKKTAVNEVSFQIDRGEMFGLLGVNGAGKTTLIKMLSCLTKPTSGDANLFGKSILTDPKVVKTNIAVSPQETAVAPNLTVRENLELMAGAHNYKKLMFKQSVDEMIELLSLQKIERNRAKTLSGGWQRRLSIAMALISEPRILFLDEPTLGLDILARQKLWQLIDSLKGKTTIVLTTHYLEEARTLCDRVCIMKAGRVKAIGTVEEINRSVNTNRFEDAFVKLVMEGE